VDLDVFRLLGLVVFKALFDKSKVPSSLAMLASCALKWSRSGLLDTPSKADFDATEFDRTVAGVYSNQLKGICFFLFLFLFFFENSCLTFTLSL